MKIGIIGGGFMGLTLAHKLAGEDREIKIFERNAQIGGLATWHDFGDFVWDRFYHVILPGDSALLEVIDELGLSDELRWKQTYTGYYVNRKFYSVSNNKEFLLFPPLSLWDKFRLGLTILYGSRIKDWRKLEQQTIEEWLVRVGGRSTFEKFWKPLLLAKLGENYQRVSAVFIWSYIKRLFEARGSADNKEKMGYVRGGYKTVFQAMETSLAQRNCRILTGTTVEKIRPNPKGGLDVTFDGQTEHFDKVVFTSPVNVLKQVADPALINFEGDTGKVDYLGVACGVLATTREITPYYVLNVAEEKVPFTGVIGMTTLVDPQEMGGHHITYWPKYVISDDPILRRSDEELKAEFMAGIRWMYPDLKDEEIVSFHMNRAIKVQPLQVLNYSQIIPRVETRHPDFFVLNTSQFISGTLNNNSVAEHVKGFVSDHRNKLIRTSSPVSTNADKVV